MARRRGRLLVVSGPSGVGKDTVLDHFHPLLPDVIRCVTATTRAPRSGEVDGVDYFFLTLARFQEMVNQDAFLEYAPVNGNFYGTPKAWVNEQRAQGHDVLLKIDVQGGLNVRTQASDAVLVFLLPPSIAELERRLRFRSTETEEQIMIRLLDARSELQQMPRYDYAVVNDDIERAADLLRAIFISERCRIHVHESGYKGPSIPWNPTEIV